ncbi:MAG: class I adenylate-forming enzyme family protein [Pseudomonadota bacterium]
MPYDGPPLTTPCDIPAILALGLKQKPNAVAVIDRDRSFTWQDLDDLSSRLAANYLELGLKAGDRIASLLPNRAVLIVHYIACLRVGLVANPLSYQYTANEIRRAIVDTSASALVAHSEREPDVATADIAAQLAVDVIYYSDGAEGVSELQRLLEREPENTSLPNISTDNAAFIIHTSGSTGRPKGVTHSVGGLAWAVASIAAAFQLTSNDVVLPCSSISRGGGIHLSFTTLAVGGLIVVPWTTDASELLPLMRAHHPTIMAMLPAALFQLVRSGSAVAEHFSSLRCMLSGGDKVPAELEEEFRNLAQLEIQESYGITELGIVTHNSQGESNRLGSVGKPNPGFALSLRNEEGDEVETGQVGRLWVASPTATIGYWDNPEATMQAMRDGWFDTGDLMRCDEDGYLWFAGRRSQIIVHDGHNISPQEVEQALLEHPSVALAGVVGIRNLMHGESVRAYITIRQDAERPSHQALIDFARERVGVNAPEEFIVLDEMPLIGDGKIDRVLLKKMTAEEKDAHQL